MTNEMPKDIVQELHIRAAIEQIPETLFERAAVEITRLRGELDTRIAMCDTRSEKIVELTNERDEARRMVCMIMGGKGGRSSYISPDAVDYANSRGWDCFNDNKNA